jgi:hypothetical protein
MNLPKWKHTMTHAVWRQAALSSVVLAIAAPGWAQIPFGPAAPPAGGTNPAGGNLLPPPPPPSLASINTQQALEHSERKDSGRGLSFFWVDPEIGGRWYDFDFLGGSDLGDTGGYREDGFTPSIGLGVGARFLYLTGGARFRYNVSYWTAGLEGALRIPIGALEPYVFVGGGYLRSITYQDKCGGCLEDMVISGGYGALGSGVDYFLTPVFALGARLDAEVMFVGRDAVPGITEGVYSRRGSGVGLSANAGLHVSLHF